jgi:hypothetical protein
MRCSDRGQLFRSPTFTPIRHIWGPHWGPLLNMPYRKWLILAIVRRFRGSRYRSNPDADRFYLDNPQKPPIIQALLAESISARPLATTHLWGHYWGAFASGQCDAPTSGGILTGDGFRTAYRRCHQKCQTWPKAHQTGRCGRTSSIGLPVWRQALAGEVAGRWQGEAACYRCLP